MSEQLVGPYRVLQRLGSGGMGDVFLAEDSRLHRFVALKRLKEGLLDEDGRARFRREAEIAAGLSHPGIVPVYDWVEEEGRDWLVMAYVPGPDLKAWMLLQPSRYERFRVARQVCEALHAAHRKGIVHRDLKSENVLLDEDGFPKITDFGLARFVDASGFTAEGSLMGTARTMAPEQALGKAADHRADLFSLGVLFFEMFVGRSPFLADSTAATLHRIVYEQAPDPTELGVHLDPRLRQILDRMLEKNPMLRAASCEEILPVLRELEREQVSVADAVGENTLDGETLGTAPSLVSPVYSAAEARGSESKSAFSFSPRMLLLAALILLVFLIFRLGDEKNLSSPILAGKDVAVLVSSEDQSLPPLVAMSLSEAVVSTLSHADHFQIVDADSQEMAFNRLGVDEVVTVDAVCDTNACAVQITRLGDVFGKILARETLSVDPQRLVSANEAVVAAVGRIFDVELQLGRDPVPAESFETLMQLKVARDQSELPITQLLERCADLRRAQPRFLGAHLLEAGLALDLFHETRDTGHLQTARKALARAEDLNAGDPRLLQTAFYLHESAGEFEQAQEVLVRLEKRFPGSLQVLDRRARLLEKQGKRLEAMAVKEEALRRRPSRARRFNLALSAYELGDVTRARGFLEAMLAVDANDRAAREMLALLELNFGDPTIAVEVLEPLAAERESISILTNLGVAWMMIGRADRAESSLRKVVAAAPQHPLTHLNLADALAIQGKSEASDHYGKVLALLNVKSETMDLDDHLAAAQAFAHMGRNKEALESILAAVALRPEDPQVLFTAALVYSLVEDEGSARLYREKSLSAGVNPRWFDLPWFQALDDDRGLDFKRAGSQ